MTIRHAARFMQAAPAGYDGVFDWDFLKGAFPRGIEPMDIDANVEINGWFLAFETKDDGVPIKEGQMKALTEMAQTGLWHIIFLWGKLEPHAWAYMRRDFHSSIMRGAPLIVRHDIKDFCKRWAIEADRGRSPRQPDWPHAYQWSHIDSSIIEPARAEPSDVHEAIRNGTQFEYISGGEHAP